ncbi:MAG: hypothetical protein M3509_04300, partial [Chloroflexota bacterium]|nr:hypothetical protein [Chloroflexota bacterium]
IVGGASGGFCSRARASVAGTDAGYLPPRSILDVWKDTWPRPRDQRGERGTGADCQVSAIPARSFNR